MTQHINVSLLEHRYQKNQTFLITRQGLPTATTLLGTSNVN